MTFLFCRCTEKGEKNLPWNTHSPTETAHFNCLYGLSILNFLTGYFSRIVCFVGKGEHTRLGNSLVKHRQSDDVLKFGPWGQGTKVVLQKLATYCTLIKVTSMTQKTMLASFSQHRLNAADSCHSYLTS